MIKAIVVEDSKIYREFLCALLLEQYPDMLIATSEGGQLLELIDGFGPNVVFMDIKLPGASGIQLTSAIKDAHHGLPVIIVSGFCDEEYRLAARDAGAACFLSKDDLNDYQIAEILNALISEQSDSRLHGRQAFNSDRVRALGRKHAEDNSHDLASVAQKGCSAKKNKVRH